MRIKIESRKITKVLDDRIDVSWDIYIDDKLVENVKFNPVNLIKQMKEDLAKE